MPETHSANGQPKNADVHFERSDVKPRGVLVFAGALTILAIAVHLALYGMFRHFQAREDEAKRSAFALPEPSLMPQIPEGQPVLEGIDPRHNIGRYGRAPAQGELSSEEERLRS